MKTLELMNKVTIKDLNVSGILMGILLKPHYEEYNVEYFYDGERRSEWYRDFQLEPFNA